MNSQSSRHWLALSAFGLLFILAVPWYWNALAMDPVYPLWLGLPRWFIVTIFHSVLVSFLTAWVIWKNKAPTMDSSGQDQ